MLIALLLSIQKVAEVVTDAGNNLGINMPPVPIFRQANLDVFIVALGAMLLLLSVAFIVPVVKFAVIGAGLALFGYAAVRLYKMFKGDPVTTTLPDKN